MAHEPTPFRKGIFLNALVYRAKVAKGLIKVVDGAGKPIVDAARKARGFQGNYAFIRLQASGGKSVMYQAFGVGHAVADQTHAEPLLDPDVKKFFAANKGAKIVEYFSENSPCGTCNSIVNSECEEVE